MGLQAYRSVLSARAVRQVLLLSFVIRIPMWAGNVILTLHVVTHLHRSYAAAGLVAGAATVALSISAPWRGRRLDRVGLRRTVLPSLVVLALCWSVAPFVGYWPLLGLASLAGLFVVPSFSIVRQALMHAVEDDERKSALSIDSVMVELSFMIGPALGVLLATYWRTSWALLVCEFASIAGAAVLYLANPPLRAVDEPDDVVPSAELSAPTAAAITTTPHDATGVTTLPHSGHLWASRRVLAVLGMSVAATLVLTGTDVGVVAAMREFDRQAAIGWVLAVWGLGSAIGGLVYGAMRATVPVVTLLGLLAATTVPTALVSGPLAIAAVLFVAGLFCAPTITATVHLLSQLVPERARGEAMGWHGSAMTAGSAIGAPIAGVAIDTFGWRGAFVLAGVLGLALAAAGALSLRGQPVRVAVDEREEARV